MTNIQYRIPNKFDILCSILNEKVMTLLMTKSLQVNPGYIVPESYYITSSKEEFFIRPDVERVLIEKQSKVDVTVEVTHPRSIIEWEYGIKNKDIGFGLYQMEDTNDSTKNKELIPIHRVDPSCSTESGMYFCEKSGTCKLPA